MAAQLAQARKLPVVQRLLMPPPAGSAKNWEFAQRGAELDADGRAHAGPLALVELQNGSAAPSFIAGTANFYALTRYNRPSDYAMAVIELGRSVASARKRGAW